MAPVYGTIERPRRLRLRSDRPTGHYNGFIAIEAEKQCHAVARIWRVWTLALVDKVADIREYTVTQIHSQQLCSVSGAKFRFKPLEDIGR
jgi:hypothetical protein